MDIIESEKFIKNNFIGKIFNIFSECVGLTIFFGWESRGILSMSSIAMKKSKI